MGDPRNWSPEKLQRVRAENAAADRAELAVCELFDHGPDLDAGPLSPCTVMNHLGYSVESTCAGCLRVRKIRWAELSATRLSHQPWALVMRRLVCGSCGSGPRQLAFSRPVPGGGGTKKGVLSRAPPPPRQHLF